MAEEWTRSYESRVARGSRYSRGLRAEHTCVQRRSLDLPSLLCHLREEETARSLVLVKATKWTESVTQRNYFNKGYFLLHTNIKQRVHFTGYEKTLPYSWRLIFSFSQSVQKIYSATIHFERYFPVVLFIMLYKVVLALSLWIKSWSVIIQMKATEQYFPLVLFVLQYLSKRNLGILSALANELEYAFVTTSQSKGKIWHVNSLNKTFINYF